MENTEYILSAHGIYKSFPGVLALENVDFFLKKAEIHALMGENGAGKSTLIKALTGVEQPDKGFIEFNGNRVVVHSPHAAQEIGISTVYQEINLCTNISVAENILLGHEPKFRLGSLNWRKMNELAEKALMKLGISIDVSKPLGNYPVAIQQMVAITRSLEISSSKVLILDEPTSSLDINETKQLFTVMRKLKADGMGIVFITHFLDQVYEISDRITVLTEWKTGWHIRNCYLTKIEIDCQYVGKKFGRTG